MERNRGWFFRGDRLRGTRRRSIFYSPLARRILAINSLTLVIPIVGLLYLDDYRESLLKAELDLLGTQARLIASSLANTATLGPSPEGDYRLVPEWSRQSIRLLVGDMKTRIRLFGLDARLMADSYRISGDSAVEVEPLPPPGPKPSWMDDLVVHLYDFAVEWLPSSRNFDPYHESSQQTAQDYIEAARALTGEMGSAIRDAGNGRLILTVAVPVQRYRQILGALMVSGTSENVALALRDTRLTVLGIFALALSATILLSFYLSSTIAWPLAKLAHAAEQVRKAKGRRVEIPDMGHRRDEIGDLSLALRDMTDAVLTRMAATERFAADVAHEIKNPLTSLRSAVETVARIDDPNQQRKLMGIILDDVGRLNRLISDISDASRIDSEMVRDEMSKVNFGALVETLTDVLQSSGAPLQCNIPPFPIYVHGQEGRLVQILRNLIANAQSFSPAGSIIRLNLHLQGNRAILWVDDSGPGIPPSKLDKIFERFYTERPEGEKFGTHSGLGLSISRQIAEAHNGTLRAENRVDDKGAVVGARFLLDLPAVQ